MPADQTSEQLEESERQYQDLYDYAPDMFVSVDAATAKIINCNQAVAHKTGYTKDEIIGRPIFDMYTPASAAVAKREVFPRFINEGKVEGLELQLQCKDGRVLDVSLNVSAVLDENGDILSSRSVWRDITAHKQAEAAQLASEEKFRNLFQHSHDAIFIHDLAGTIIDANSKAADLFGYTREEIASMPMSGLQPPESMERARQAFESIMRDGFVSLEIDFVKKDGTLFPADISASLFTIGDQKVIQGIVRDVTLRKRAEARSRELNRLNETLLDTASLEGRLKLITDAVVKVLAADFARIWIIRPADLCDHGCPHADVTEGPHVCRNREFCLHLMVSSGRYTHIDGGHRRVPFGCYKIGKIAAGMKPKFLTNDVVNDPRVHDREWARKCGLVSFAGYRLLSGKDEIVGVLALFSKQAITPGEDALLETIVGSTAQVIQTANAEDELRLSEEKFKLIAENSADVIYKVNIATEQYTYASPSMEQVFGYTCEEILGLRVGDTFTAEAYAYQRQKIKTALLKGQKEPDILELDVLHKDGRVIPVEIHARFIYSDQGLPEEILGIARDITWRREAEQALKKSEHRYRSLVNTMREGLIEVDSDWNIKFVNDSFITMTGFSEAQLKSSSLFDLMSDKSLETAKKELSRRRSGKAGMYEVELARADGEKLYALISPVASYDSDDRYLGSSGVISDITELKLSTEKLRRSEQRFKFLAENMGDVVWTMDLDLNTTYVSPSIKKLFDYTPGERIKQKLEEMVTLDSMNRIRALLIEELERDKSPGVDPDRTATIDVEYYHRDGSIIWMENKVKAIRDKDGHTVGIYGVSRNITDRKAAEAALIAEKEKLQDAIVKIKKLSGLLPICASCKKIRDDKGYWNQIESYIRDHSEADFSHSICPECVRKLYPDLDF